MFWVVTMYPSVVRWFQLIYARGMFSRMKKFSARSRNVSTHICVGIVSRFARYGVGGLVSTHICVGNVSQPHRFPYGQIRVSTHMCAGNVLGEHRHIIGMPWTFQLIYACGMFRDKGIITEDAWRFNSYMRGECFRVTSTPVIRSLPFQLIYARGMFLSG